MGRNGRSEDWDPKGLGDAEKEERSVVPHAAERSRKRRVEPGP